MTEERESSRFDLPAAVKPVWELVVHLAIGAVAFASVLMIAVLLAGLFICWRWCRSRRTG